jgi:hypothetical protein
MMDLDRLREKWMEQDAKLDASIRLNLRVATTMGARPALRRFSILQAASAVGTAVAILFFANFAVEHRGAAHLAIAGGALALLAIALLHAQIRMIVAASSLDYASPVALLKRRVEEMRILRIQTVRWTMALSCLAGPALMLVLLRAFAGIDAWMIFDRAWMAANVAFGAAMIPVVFWVARKFESRLARDLAGTDLSEAMDSLSALAEFEKVN